MLISISPQMTDIFKQSFFTYKGNKFQLNYQTELTRYQILSDKYAEQNAKATRCCKNVNMTSKNFVSLTNLLSREKKEAARVIKPKKNFTNTV